MSIIDTNWGTFLEPDSEMPPDVIFHVIENCEVDGDRDDRKTGQVSAHKFILGGVSHVFRKMFFGAMKENGDIVEIKETTKEAFATLINYVYCPPGLDKFSLDHLTCPQGRSH